MEEEFYKEFLYGKEVPDSPLIESESWLSALLENTLASIMILKAIRGKGGTIVDFEYLYINKKAEDSIDRRDLKGKRYLQEYPESIIFGLFQKYVGVTENGIPWEDVINLKNDDTWKSIKAVKLDDGCLIMFSDITAQKKAEQELNENREFLRSVIDLSLTGLSVFKSVRNEKGQVVDFEWVLANRKIEQISGFINLKGKKFSEIFSGFRESELFSRYVSIVESDIIQDFEIQLSPNKDVPGQWYHILARKLNDGLVSSTDIVTERKNTEKELLRIKDELTRRAEDKFLGLFNNMDQGFCIIELIYNERGEAEDYFFRDVNPSFEHHTFLGDVKGRRAREVLPSLDQKLLRTFGKVAKTGIPIHFEDKVSSLNDAWFDVHAFCFDKNEKAQVAVLFTNITERKIAEEHYFKSLEDDVRRRTAELNESKDLVEEITKVSPDLITIHEVGTNLIIFTNSENIDLSAKRFMLSEVKRLRSKIHPDDRKKANQFFQQRKLLKNGEIIEVELRTRMRDREWGWIKERSKVFRKDEKGNATQIITFASDITLHKTAEMKLREQSLLVQRITDTTPDLLYVIDMMERKIIYISNNVVQMLGYKTSEIYRMKRSFFRTIVHPEDFNRVIAQIDNLFTIKPEEIRETEFRLRDSHFNIHWLNVRYTLFESYNGIARQVLAVGQDISDKKFAEAAYDEERFRNDELKRINDLMDTFVFAAAHELKAPISNLKLLTSVIENSNDRELKCALLKKYNPIIENLEGTIAGLISVLEIEKTTGECVRKLYFDDILHEILSEQHQRVDTVRPQINTDFSWYPSITYTESYLLSIFRNMITNALKYRSPDRDLIINISSSYSGNHVLLTFSDNGIGIDLELYKKDMFKPFKRFSKQSSGSGIGLHLIKSIVTRNGGRIEAESEVGKGTTFKIYLVENIISPKC